MSVAKIDILVRVETTPNPLAVKIVANIPFIKEGKATFTSEQECRTIPLFENLFLIAGTQQIHVFENQLSLSHEGQLSFEDIEKQATQIVKQYGQSHSTEFPKSTKEDLKKPKKDLSQLPETHKKVEEILNRTIRPSLQADGGDIEVISVDGDRVNIMYEGACGGCPSAFMGTLESIENILKYELQNENIEVCPV